MSGMGRAVNFNAAAVSVKSATVLLLTLAIIALAIQPCFAAASATRTHCCPSHTEKCHTSAAIEFCAMSTTTLASPEGLQYSESFTTDVPQAAMMAPLNAEHDRERQSTTPF